MRPYPSNLHDDAFVSASRLLWVLGLLDLAYQHLECLLDVLVVLCAGLGPRALELSRECLALLFLHLPLLGPYVALVADDDYGYPVDALSEIMRSNMALS